MLLAATRDHDSIRNTVKRNTYHLVWINNETLVESLRSHKL
jgi:hypothetical protein